MALLTLFPSVQNRRVLVVVESRTEMKSGKAVSTSVVLETPVGADASSTTHCFWHSPRSTRVNGIEEVVGVMSDGAQASSYEKRHLCPVYYGKLLGRKPPLPQIAGDTDKESRDDKCASNSGERGQNMTLH
jgi:hypothetical protein